MIHTSRVQVRRSCHSLPRITSTNPRLTPDPHTHSICGLAVGCTAAEMCVLLGILALCCSARMLYSLFYVLLWLLTFLSLVFFRSIITVKRISRPDDVLDHSFCTVIADK